MKSLFKLVFSVNVIGNPLNFVKDIKLGLINFVDRPI